MPPVSKTAAHRERLQKPRRRGVFCAPTRLKPEKITKMGGEELREREKAEKVENKGQRKE